MRELPRDLTLILRTEAANQRKPPIDYAVAEDGLRMVVRPDPDVAMAELLEEAATALVAAEARATAAEAKYERLRAAFRANALRWNPEMSHAEIDAEIERAIGRTET